MKTETIMVWGFISKEDTPLPWYQAMIEKQNS